MPESKLVTYLTRSCDLGHQTWFPGFGLKLLATRSGAAQDAQSSCSVEIKTRCESAAFTANPRSTFMRDLIT
jgi:hypothetical protein